MKNKRGWGEKENRERHKKNSYSVKISYNFVSIKTSFAAIIMSVKHNGIIIVKP